MKFNLDKPMSSQSVTFHFRGNRSEHQLRQITHISYDILNAITALKFLDNLPAKIYYIYIKFHTNIFDSFETTHC